MSAPIFPQYITSKQPNTPQMTGGTGSEGQILQVLDALLVDGCCPNTVVTATIEGEKIKLDFGVLHGYLIRQFITISGATSPALNGTHRIISLSATTVYIVKGGVTDVTGTLKTILSPLGWERMFGKTDPLRRAFRSSDITTTRTVLHLDCTSPKSGTYPSKTNPVKRALVNCYEDMSSITEGVGSTTATENNRALDGMLHWIQQSANTLSNPTYTTTISDWVLVGDGKLFYFMVTWCDPLGYYGSKQRCVYMFGDMPRLSTADTSNCILAATRMSLLDYATYDLYNSALESFSGELNSMATQGVMFLRDVTGSALLDKANRYAFYPLSGNSVTVYSGNSIGLNRVNPLTLGYTYSTLSFVRSADRFFGGTAPYIRAIPSQVSDSGASDLSIIAGHLHVRVAPSHTSSIMTGYFAFDLETPRDEDVLI